MRPEIATRSGKLVNPFDLQPEDVDVLDIAHALSNTCRWTGHTSRFYSVAEHSVRVAERARELLAEVGHGLRAQLLGTLWGLLHDAPEAYLVDMPRPLKGRMIISSGPGQGECDGAWWRLEDRIASTVLAGLGLGPLNRIVVAASAVEIADRGLLATEARDLMHGTDGWSFDPGPPLDGRIDMVYGDPLVWRAQWLLRLRRVVDELVLMEASEVASVKPIPVMDRTTTITLSETVEDIACYVAKLVEDYGDATWRPIRSEGQVVYVECEGWRLAFKVVPIGGGPLTEPDPEVFGDLDNVEPFRSGEVFVAIGGEPTGPCPGSNKATPSGGSKVYCCTRCGQDFVKGGYWKNSEGPHMVHYAPKHDPIQT
jgi:hypothetical protein